MKCAQFFETIAMLLPGSKPKDDAQLYAADTCTCSRAVQVHEVAPNPMTHQAAMQIPMKDNMSKAEAWRQLSERDDASIDVTEHDPFKWWLFLSNLAPNTPKAFGTGITSVQIKKREKDWAPHRSYGFVGAVGDFDPTKSWLQNTACYIFSVDA